MSAHPRFAGASLLLLAFAAACSSDDSAAACGEVVEEQLDPASAVHIIDPADGPEDPAPTSGPHLSVGEPGGVLDEPLPAAVQLRALEIGKVMVQYRDDTDAAELADWAPPDAVVAPNDRLAAPVVATAWLRRMNCEFVDTDALSEFVDEHARDSG